MKIICIEANADEQIPKGKVKCFAVSVGEIPPTHKKTDVKSVKNMQTIDGFVGFISESHQDNQLWAFDTLDNAKFAKSLIDCKGIKTGKDIREVFVEENIVKAVVQKCQEKKH